MSDRYPGGLITKTPVTPTGPYAEGSASGVWTLDQAMQYTKQGIWPQASNPTPSDPYFQYVTSLLHGDGTNGGQNNTFLDSSTNAFTITRNGNTTQGSFSPYGSNWGNYFNGSSYLTTPSSITLGSGDLTIEGWISPSNTSGTVWYDFRGADSGSAGNNPVIQWSTVTSGKFTVRIDGTNAITSSGTFSVGAWYHVALVRSGTTVTLYVNGISQGTYTTSTNFATAYVRIGAYGGDGTLPLTGYSSNLRAVVGTAVYTSAFTPSTTPLTAISGTSLLTCQSNRFVDSSANAYTFTLTGTPQVTRFSPFAPTYATQYSASTIGGSGYFDATGDYLAVASGSSAVAMGTGDFTIEAWYYPVSTISSEIPTIFSSTQSDSVSVTAINLNVFDDRTVRIGDAFTTSNTVTVGAWNHIVASRVSGTTKIFINGVQGSSNSDSNNYTSNNCYVGARYAGGGIKPYINGYLCDVKVTKGSGVTSVTVPTSPVSSSGSALLTNFTNGAIYDNAMIPDYETVGNAQISTSVKKYGTGSLAFDGDGDYLKANQGVGFEGNFTVEMWVYITDAAKGNYFFSTKSSGNSGQYLTIRGNYSGGNQVLTMDFNGSSATGPNLSASTWYHIAVARAGSTMKLFLNGTQVNSLTSSTAVLCDSIAPIIGGTGYLSDMSGYIDDVRITKGYARYWENFTPPTAALPNFGGAYQVPTQDPQFNYTTLLLPGNGTNGAQNNTFLDSSTNAFTITRNGNTTQGTFTPFSQTGWGNYFDGSGDYINAASNAAFALPGDFTLEAWIYPTVDLSTTERFVFWANGTGGIIFGNRPGGFGIRQTDTGDVLLISNRPAANTWTHVAAVRSGSTLSIYYNGTLQGSTTSAASFAQQAMYVGGASGTEWTGYISNARIVKGTAVYTANFTPPTAALTAISGTSLLTCQSNRFVDNSTNAFAITVGGNPSVQAFSPFAPTAAYSASTVGGSGYFDGTGDYLTTSSTQIIPTGSFTIEAWVYTTNTNSTTKYIVAQGSSGNSGRTGLGIESSAWWFQVGDDYVNSGTPVLGQWNYVAMTFNGSTLQGYVNGVSQGSISHSGNAQNTTLSVGTNWNSAVWNGYISSVRISNTVRTVTSVPTAPFSNDANTTFLANYTNAGITDATAKNDLETVGNAQISTTQSKFGGSSMVFNGSSDYLKLASSPNISFGSGDFTVEAWVYINSTTSYMTLMASYPYHQNGISTVAFRVGTSGTYASWTDGGGTPAASLGGLSWSTATWYHVAWCRYNGVVTMYRNGQVVGTVSDSTNFSVGGQTIGADFDASTFTNGYNGYINDFRITKGYARYVQPFTPPAQADQLY